MRIYTRTGDTGETGLFGGGRVLKSDLRVEAYGAVDELNSVIGLAVTQLTTTDSIDQLTLIQSDLFSVGAHLATPAQTKGRRPELPELPTARVSELERWIDGMEEQLPQLTAFILPGGSMSGATVHLARTVSRRAERRIIALAQVEAVDPAIVVYVNRLSDYLFVLARYTNSLSGVAERPWTP